MKEGPNPSRKSFHSKVKEARVAIIYAEWNSEITHALRDGAIATCTELGIPQENIDAREVSGAFEMPLAIKYAIESQRFDAVIGIGCLVKGETPHFHYISEVVSHRVSELSVEHSIPVGYGLLTVNKYEEAQARAGGDFGNKGSEAAEAALHLLSLKYEWS